MLASSLVLLTQIVVWHGYSGSEQAALDRVVADYNRQQTEVAVDAELQVLGRVIHADCKGRPVALDRLCRSV